MSDLYIAGAFIIDEVLSKQGSLKGLVLAKTKGTKIDAKALLALTANTLAYLRPLNLVLDKVEILQLEKRAFLSQKGVNARSLALLLAHDLLLNPRGRIGTSNAWPPKVAIVKHAIRLKAELTKLQIKEGKSDVKELRAGEVVRQKAERIPRWARVNERLTSTEEVLEILGKEGWSEATAASQLLPKQKVYVRSLHLSSVLAFHSSQTSLLIAHELYQKGHLILQDLASCFPAEVLLRLELHTKQVLHVLDATAAPGNKTTHLSALLALRGGESKITAFEHSPERYKTLIKQLSKAGSLQQNKAGIVTGRKCDFTKQDPNDFADVTHMLVDPSCSGSGILSRLDYLTAEEDEENASDVKMQERLNGLSAFQLSMLEHAFHFPNLRRLVYSTCSIHQEENEGVVMRALSSDIAKSKGWKLATRQDVLPSWSNRGLPEYCNGDQELANSMIRCEPGGTTDDTTKDATSVDVEATNGFFLACFIRPASNAAKNRKRNERAREKVKEAKRAKKSHGIV